MHSASVLLSLPLAVLSQTPSFLFMLGDDIGWSDFRYNNGTAVTPRLTEWISRKGTVLFQDFHTGGTVCSPTRATVLTGRNHFRDCVNYVYDCSDMTQCVPDFEFAPQGTFTIGDAVRAAGKGYASHFGGKVRLRRAARLLANPGLPPPHPSPP
jgi:arylsulfatase A-like enzyme